MVDILKYDTNFKMKGFTFEDCGHSITYVYHYRKLHYFLKNIIKNRGNFINSITDYKNYDLDTSKRYINFSEMVKNDKSYITRFTIDIAKSCSMLQYEYLIYNKIHRIFDGELLQFPRPELFFYSKDIVHMGYVLHPNLISDFKINQVSRNYYSLKEILDNNERLDIKDIIAIVLQVLCTLSILGDKLQFTHYNCNINNLYVYRVNDKTTKYLYFNLSFGEVYIPTKYVIMFSGLEEAHINLQHFTKSKMKDVIIQYWIEMGAKTSKFSSNYDIYTFINSIFGVLTRSDGSNFLSKRISGPIDKRTFFSILCKNIVDEWERGSGDYTYKTPDDLIQTFHEMGLSSLRLPSNKRVQIYGCGKNGEIKRTRLTYSNIKQHRSNSESDEENINIDNCSWKEIRNIAKEFGLKSRGKGINKAFLKRKIREEIPFYKS